MPIQFPRLVADSEPPRIHVEVGDAQRLAKQMREQGFQFELRNEPITYRDDNSGDSVVLLAIELVKGGDKSVGEFLRNATDYSKRFDALWARVGEHAGQRFAQKQGGEFTYVVRGDVVNPSTTERNLTRNDFKAAWNRRPLKGPGELQDLQGPSFLFAILTDPRIAD